ncbi:MAG: T9SS type A sorting domain-containing protein [Cytophagaceae bacterium]|nr:T9SS type A sorting domain-containing protein [Cytophagaceae bacterium]
MMRILYLILAGLLMGRTSLCHAQFLGGESSGHANTRLSNTSCSVVNVNPFLGGVADGHQQARLANVVCSAINVNPFSGGISDGHANLRMANVTCSVINVNPFSGGVAEGHSNERMVNVVCTTINVNPFAGGEADGHSNSDLINNPLCIPLEAELLTFFALPTSSSIDLIWSTSYEKDHDRFTVEKSKDGMAFEKIAEIKAVGNSAAVIQYNTSDSSPWKGKSYYRLKLTDIYGAIEFSSLVPVYFDGLSKAMVQAYPNPFSSALVLKPSETTDRIRVELMNPLGLVVYQEDLIEEFSIPTFHFSSGIYILKCSSGTKTEILKVIKE